MGAVKGEHPRPQKDASGLARARELGGGGEIGYWGCNRVDKPSSRFYLT